MSLQITPELFEALCHVLSYLYDEEQTHYELQPPDFRDGHIYESLLVISNFVDLVGQKLLAE